MAGFLDVSSLQFRKSDGRCLKKGKISKRFLFTAKNLFDIHLLLLIVRLHKAFLTSSSMKFPP